MTIDRRAFMAAAGASVVTPTPSASKDVPKAGMDWQTMSLEARNLAYNNVHFTILDELRRPNSLLTRAVVDLAEIKALRLGKLVYS